ncbi:hypothetical protein KN815_21400 [Streptomyces sp. 4503]|uniref:Uncharacterized protein n=1 Tax=Streptomyces niphimycinicus TaxID=2842201 RepID=A0ABS6CHX3_9ACTN|nr:hypothetical protein [Streptomyces niphimycinicus]MBU3866525.1 hypothetical protein [Streptomyces niphimycinicus]
MEHQGGLAADLDEADAVRTQLAAHPHHHLGDALTTTDELARCGRCTAEQVSPCSATASSSGKVTLRYHRK